MTITTETNNGVVTTSLSGRLDTTTAPQLEEEFKSKLADANELVLNLKELEYLSSAGLRVILGAKKQMDKKGGMVVRNVNDTIMEIFEVTGFSDILTIE